MPCFTDRPCGGFENHATQRWFNEWVLRHSQGETGLVGER